MDSPLIAGIVRSLERRGLLLAGGEATVTRLAGGGWNDVFRLQAPGLDWVVKLYNSGQQASLFPMLPEAELQALQALKGQKVAPEPIALLPVENDIQGLGRPMLVYQYYAGAHWNGDVAAA